MSFHPRFLNPVLTIFLQVLGCFLLFASQVQAVDEYDCSGEITGECRLPETCQDDFFTKCPLPGSDCCPDPIPGITGNTTPNSNLTLRGFRNDEIDDEDDVDGEDFDDISDLFRGIPRNWERRYRTCRITPSCAARGGFCAPRKKDCSGKVMKKKCKGRCFCCVPSSVTLGTCPLTGLPGVVCSKHQTCAGYGSQLNGIYEICPVSNCPPIKVRCMDDGWTVILYRDTKVKPRCNFARDWLAYKQGFCHASRDYWIGNEILSVLTNRYPYYKMQMTGITASGETRSMKYNRFYVQGETSSFRVYTDYYDSAGSTAPDQFRSASNGYMNLYGTYFTTFDRDNDRRSNMNCVDFMDNGGWWFNSCTGLLVTKKPPLQWYYWSSTEYGPVEVEKVYMRIKPN